MTRYISPCIVSRAYLKPSDGDLQNDIDLDFFCQALVGAEIEQLKRTSGRNAVMVDLPGQKDAQEGGDDDDDETGHEPTRSGSHAGRVAAVGS